MLSCVAAASRAGHGLRKGSCCVAEEDDPPVVAFSLAVEGLAEGLDDSLIKALKRFTISSSTDM